MPARVVKAPVAVAPVYSWTGFYVGGALGGAWMDTDWRYSNVNPYTSPVPAGPQALFGVNHDASSWVAGGQIGYNHQINQWVIGVEASGYGTGLKDTVSSNPGFPPPVTISTTTKIDALFTAVARVGIVVAPQWLLYAKGGYAGGEVKTSGTFAPPFAGFILDWSTSKWHNGWTAGAGFDYRVNKNITLGVAYDYIDLSSERHTGAISGGFITAANQVQHDVSANIHMVTVRANWLFNQ